MLGKNSIKNTGENKGTIVSENKGVINNYYGDVGSEKISILSKVIKNLAETAYYKELEITNKNDYIPYDIEKKMEYNLIIKNRFKFNKYKVFYQLCDSVLNMIDNTLLSSKNKLMNLINDYYEEILGEIFLNSYKKNEKKSKIELIQEQADEIIDLIKNKLIKILESDEIYYEDKELGVNIILCYAFMQCKILEKPPKEDGK